MSACFDAQAPPLMARLSTVSPTNNPNGGAAIPNTRPAVANRVSRPAPAVGNTGAVARRDTLRMTDDEVTVLLDEGRRVQFASHNRDGSIHLVPMAYAVVAGRIALWTDPASRKVANVRADPRVSCLVELGKEFASFRAVQITGTATVVDHPADSLAIGEALFARSLDGVLTDETKAYVSSLVSERVGIVVHPDRVVSWDHRKLAGARPDQVGH